MSTTANINVRVDADLKKSAESLFHDLGLTMPGAVTLFLRSAVNNYGIPFEIKRAEPDAVTKAALAEYGEMKRNPDRYKRYRSADELLREVLQDT
ncbi:MAG: type II toxin-antitoxin system RelB/DinJ family antitoxin [Oscillibacter sp.]|nr:type II toxin-antitoxin system RelB/DinJ family antitoxin [Oscillibacter sp.]